MGHRTEIRGFASRTPLPPRRDGRCSQGSGSRSSAPLPPLPPRGTRPAAMAIACNLCGRGRMKGHKISHSNIKTRKISRPNLQRVRANVKGRITHLRVCTRCIRSGRVQKAP